LPQDESLLPRANVKDISELFGYPPRDKSHVADDSRKKLHCPFLNDTCEKTRRDGTPTGVCTVYNPQDETETIVCPIRLYFGDYQILRDVIEDAFGPGHMLIRPNELAQHFPPGMTRVVGLGRRWGAEVRVPRPGGQGFFFTDWILTRLAPDGRMSEFVGVEVQAIDTTGNYNAAQEAYMREQARVPASQHGLNWENVNKRILPQIVTKGRVLQREPSCQKGLYVVFPEPVYSRVLGRLGGAIEEYPLGRGSISFLRYDLRKAAASGQIRPIQSVGITRTNVETVAGRFMGARDLPPPGQVENRIREVLGI